MTFVICTSVMILVKHHILMIPSPMAAQLLICLILKAFSRATTTASRCHKASVDLTRAKGDQCMISFWQDLCLLLLSGLTKAIDWALLYYPYHPSHDGKNHDGSWPWWQLAQMRMMLPWFALKPFPQQVLHQLSSKPYVVHILFINYVHWS